MTVPTLTEVKEATRLEPGSLITHSDISAAFDVDTQTATAWLGKLHKAEDVYKGPDGLYITYRELQPDTSFEDILHHLGLTLGDRFPNRVELCRLLGISRSQGAELIYKWERERRIEKVSDDPRAWRKIIGLRPVEVTTDGRHCQTCTC